MKLRLPHKFQAALLAAIASVSFTTLSTGTLAVATGAALLAGQQALAGDRTTTQLTEDTTTGGGVTYNGHVFTMQLDKNVNFATRNFKEATYNTQTSQWEDGAKVYESSNSDIDTPLGRGYFWRMYCSAANLSNAPDFGTTLRFAGATSQAKVQTDFSDFTIGGLIAEGDKSGAGAGADATYWLCRNASMDINGLHDVNMDINAHVTFSYKDSINLKKGGTWNIHEGKSLTFNNNSSTSGNDTTFIFYENQALIVKGGGTLALDTRPISSGDSVNMRAGSSLTVTGTGTTVKLGNGTAGINTINGTITVETGSILNINANTTLGRTITNAGTLTVANGKTVTLTSDLSGFEHDISSYTNEQGVPGADGFAKGVYYTIINNSGTSNLESVKLAGASTATTLDDQGRIYVEDTQYGTYYINTNGATLNLDAAVAYAAGHSAGVTLSHVEVGAASASINVANTQSLALLSGAGNVAKTGSGTLMLTGSNTGFSGAVNVTAGTLDLASSMGLSDLSVANGATLKLAGAGMLSAGNLTLASGSVLDVSNITQMAGLTVDLASYTGTVSYEGATVSGVGSWLDPTLNAADGMLRLTFASKPQPTPTPVADLGKVMYVGDSITDGVNGGGVHAKSWRYSFFQVLADGGISQVEEGYYQHHQSSGAIPDGQTASYGGRTFENNHSAQASARSGETAGTVTSSMRSDYNRYGWSSIQNWLDQKNTMRNGQPYPSDKPVYSGATAPDTFFMLLGTNDLLSEGGKNVTEAHFNTVMSSMFGYSGGTFDGQSGTFDIIWKSMTDARSDAKLIVLEMPTWSPDHGNHNTATDFAYLAKFNQKLHEWADSKNSANITIVNPNPGIVDVSNTTKPGSGVPTMFIDGLHPSAQGELLMAGNIAKQLGYAGRSVGLARASYTNPGTTTWNAADSASITVTVGAEAQTFAQDAFSTGNGYTIDFGALYGNGVSGGWADKTNGLSVQVGDGYNTGTLTFSEAYVMWGNTILYSRDNSQAGDNFRIAYVNQSVNEADHVSTGYYVWMGDQLIGEALSGVSGSFNGIQLTSTGANGTVNNLTWSNTAYAPTTTLYKNPDETKLFHLEQDNVLPTHNNTPQGTDTTITWTLTTDMYTLPSGQSSQETTLYKEISTTIGSHYTGAANANYSGNIGVRYTGTANLDAQQSVLGVLSATVSGNVYVELDNPNTVYDSWTNTDKTSVTASFNGTINGTYTVVYNGGIYNYAVRGGAYTNSNISDGSYSYVNGGTFKGGVYGGGRLGTITGGTHVTVTGGEIEGGVYGGGIGGTINGGTLVTITGGIIKGGVHGGGTGGTINGGTAVVVEGILPSISGEITADSVTLKDVTNPEGYTDGFDSYAGIITADTITLDNYTVGHLRAALVTKTLVLSHASSTTIHNLHLTACEINVGSGSNVTLADSLILGGTATYTGELTLADRLSIDVSAIDMGQYDQPVTLLSTETGTLNTTNLDTFSIDFGSSGTAPSYTLSNDNNNLVLTFAPLYDGLVWDGGAGTWDVDNTQHWHEYGAGKGTSAFVQGSDVLFEAGESTPTLGTNITAHTMTLEKDAVVKVNKGIYTLSATLAGEGTYVLPSGTGSLGSVSLDASEWTGVVQISGNITDFGLNALATENSKVELKGVTGYPHSWAAEAAGYGPTTCDLILTDDGSTPAITFTAGASSTYTAKFTGDISGHGTFVVASLDTKGNDARENFEFCGNISGWDGKFRYDRGKDTVVAFTGSATEVNAAIDRNGGTLGMRIGSNAQALQTTFTNTVDVTNLEIAGAGSSATFNNTVTVDGSFTVNGTQAAPQAVALNGDTAINGTFDLSKNETAHATVTVAANKTLDLNGDIKMDKTSTLALQQGATVQLGNSLAVSGLSNSATMVREGNTELYAAGNSSYTLSNVAVQTAGNGVTIGNKLVDSTLTSAHNATVSNAANTLTSTTVTANTLTVSGAMDLGTVTVNSGAVLALTSSSPVTIGSGSIVSGATLKVNDSPFSVDTGVFNLASDSTLDLTELLITGNDPITLGTATNGGSISCDNLAGITLDFGGVPHEGAKLEMLEGSLVLTFDQPEPDKYLVWQGGPGTWNTAESNKAWYESETSTTKTNFQTGDSVAFMVAVDSPVTMGETPITAGNVRIDEGVTVSLNSGNPQGSQLIANRITVDGDLTVTNVAISASSMVIDGHATANVEGARTGALATNVSGTGDVTKKGSGNLQLTGNNSGFTGTLTIEDGTVIAASTKALGNTPNIVLAGGNLAGANDVTVTPNGNINITSTANGTVSANLEVAQGKKLTFNPINNYDDEGAVVVTTVTASGVISGAGDIVKDGTGTLVLANSNTYSGDLNINQGTVLVSAVDALSGTGKDSVMVREGATLAFATAETPITYSADYITLDRGSSLRFSGAVYDDPQQQQKETALLHINTLYLTAASSMDLSNITVDRYGSYVLADVSSIKLAEAGILKGDVVQFVSMSNFNWTATEDWAFNPDDLISLHYRDGQLILDVTKRNTPAFYWKPSNDSSLEHPASWNTTDSVWYSNDKFEDPPKAFVNTQGTGSTVANSVYFLDAGTDGVEYINLDVPGQMYVRDFIVAGKEGDKFYFTGTSSDDKTIKLDVNRLSNFVVRENVEAHFINALVNDGEYDVIHVSKGALFDVTEIDQFGVYSMHNEGTVTVHGVGVGLENLLGHVDNTGTMDLYFEDAAYAYLFVGEVANRENARLKISAPAISRDAEGSYGDGTINNKGYLELDVTGFTETKEMDVFLSIIGETGSLDTVGSGASVYLMETVSQDKTSLGATLTRFSGGADLGAVTLVEGTSTTFSPYEETQWTEFIPMPYRSGEYTEARNYTMGAVTAGADSTMTAEKGAIVTMESFNADADTLDGKILVGTNPHGLDSSFPDASLTVEGVTKAAELEVQSGTATLRDAATLGTLTQSGGATDLNGYATVTTLTQSGGTANFNEGGYVDGGTVSGGTLDIGDGKVLTLGHAIDITENGSYTVDTTTGSINADALTLVKNMANAQYLEAVSEGETKWQSGFLEGGQQYVQVFNLGEDATLEGHGVTVTHKDAAGPMTLDNAGRGYLDTTTPAYATYYVRDNYVTGDPGARGSEKRSANFVKLSDVIEASKGEGQTAQLESVVFDQTGYNNAVDGSAAYHGTLTVDMSTKADLFHVTNSGTAQEPDTTRAAINIADVDASGDEVVVLADQNYAGVEGALELAGLGVYQIDNRGDLGTNVSLLGEETDDIDPWRGTVRLTGTAEGVEMGPLSVGSGSSASTIEFNQWTGSFAYEEGKTMESDAKILLTGTGVVGKPAISLTEGNANLLWTNTVTGQEARIDHAEGGNFSLEMTGDTSGWNGTFTQSAEGTTVSLGFLDSNVVGSVQNASVLADAGTMNVTYGGGLKTVNGNAMVYGSGDMNLKYTGTGMQVNSNISKYNGQGTMDVTVGDGTKAASATFNGDITADTLTVKADSAATLHNTTEISDIVEVDAGASLSIQNAAGTGMATITTSEDATGNAQITGGVTMQSANGQAIISGTAGEERPTTRVAGADVAVLSAAASLQIENLVLAADTMVHGTDNVGSLVVSDTVVQEMSSANAKHTKSDSTITSALTMTGTTDTTLEYENNKVYNVDFTSMCQMTQISGSAGTLVFDFTAMPEYYDWEHNFSDYGFIGVNFDMANKAIDASELTVKALTKDASGQVVERIGYYYNGGSGAVVGSIIYFQVPEPTTSTLSLLALAALAARRRRK